MADVNTETGPPPSRDRPGGAKNEIGLSIDDRPEIVLIELLFFAYRDFISDPDAALDGFGFGRAHHRVLHFVSRHPGIRVADLLDILKITKQSLGRVLKQLIDTGHIEQRPGPLDRRQRLLFPTEKGRALALKLIDLQARRVRAAIEGMNPAERKGAEHFLRLMIDPDERTQVSNLIER